MISDIFSSRWLVEQIDELTSKFPITKTSSNANSTLGATRKAVKTVIAGHKFGPNLIMITTKCALCNGVSPIKTQCRLCKLTVHRDCAKDVKHLCSQVRDDSRLVQEEHNFQPAFFMKPTFCDHCGTMLMGVIVHGLECKPSQGGITTIPKGGCGMAVHSDCKRFVCFDCSCRDNNDKKGEKGPKSGSSSTLDENNVTSISKMSLEQFQIISTLGEGTFSKVYQVKYKGNNNNNNQTYAMKVIDKANVSVHNDPESAKLEWDILNMGRSFPFLASGSCCFQTKRKLIYIMEYGPGGDLYYQLNKRGPFSENDSRFYAAEIILALGYLHKRNIIYRDLKLENVILDIEGHSKLIDFGMSKRLAQNSNKKTNTFCGTQFYLSPEIIQGKPYSFSVDWWALGVSMYELLFGVLPFQIDDYITSGSSKQNGNENHEQQMYDIILESTIKYPHKKSSATISLLEGLLTKNPEHRLGCQLVEDSEQAIKNHPFFKVSMVPEQFRCANLWQAIEARIIPPPFKPESISSSTDELSNSFQSLNIDEVPEGHNDSTDDKRLMRQDFDNFSQYAESFEDVSVRYQ